jgi:hypothetical protein
MPPPDPNGSEKSNAAIEVLKIGRNMKKLKTNIRIANTVKYPNS